MKELMNAGETQTIMLPGDVPLEMVWCPAGNFMMGAPANEKNSTDSEKPQHQVTLLYGFWMGKYALTKKQWGAVMGTTPWSAQSNVSDDMNSPAVFVSWSDTQSFIMAINSSTNLTFRLPTEAQWEYAARAGTTTRFYWGDDPDYTQIGDHAWWQGNAADSNEPYAHEVGLKLPNAWGLYDMSGNIGEWCQDWYRNYKAGAVTAPTGPVRGSDRVIRGGCWGYSGDFCRSASRSDFYPSFASDIIGFRLAR